MGLKGTENNHSPHLGTLKPAEDDRSNKEQSFYSSKKQPLVGTQLVLPTEGTKSLLSSYSQLPYPSIQHVLPKGNALTVFSRREQQWREEKAKFFSPPKEQVWRT